MTTVKFEFALVPSVGEFGLGIERVEVLAEKPDGTILVLTSENKIGVGYRIAQSSPWEERLTLDIEQSWSHDQLGETFKTLDAFYAFIGFPGFGKLKTSK